MIMPSLIIEPNMARSDPFYEALIHMHRDPTTGQSELANAHLTLLLASHVGDSEVLRDAMNRARALVPDVPSQPQHRQVLVSMPVVTTSCFTTESA